MKTYTSIRPIASLFLALVACALTSLPSQAETQTPPQPQTAEVTAIEGKASYVDPKTGETVNIVVGTKVPTGATVQTEAGAAVDLFLGRNTGVVRVNGNTSLKLERLESTRNGSDTVTETVLRVEKGEILAQVNKLSKASSYKVELPNSTVKVSEGQFQAAYAPEGTPGQGGSVVNVVSGRGQIVAGNSSRSLRPGKAYSVGGNANGNGNSSGSGVAAIVVASISETTAQQIAEAISRSLSGLAQNSRANLNSSSSDIGENQSEGQNQNENTNQNNGNSNGNNNNVGPASLPLNNTSGSELSPTVAS